MEAADELAIRRRLRRIRISQLVAFLAAIAALACWSSDASSIAFPLLMGLSALATLRVWE